MARGQRKQKFGRDVKISLDLTRKELERFDHSRMMLSRSDFLSILLAWFEETTTGASTGDKDSIMCSPGLRRLPREHRPGIRIVLCY
jgi:hypothetical protein